MNFGVWIPTCRHLATPDIIRGTAVQAEQLAYDSVWAIRPQRARPRRRAAGSGRRTNADRCQPPGFTCQCLAEADHTWHCAKV
jgi:hypothetical protein